MANSMHSASDLAPIALFAFRRPDHLRQTVQALKQNALACKSKLYLFCDAPRSEKDVEGVDQVRRYVDTIDGFASHEIVLRSSNFGLARSIITGVSEVLGQHKRVVVVEDDLVTSPCFLSFMNDGLRLYADEAKVASVHGYTYPVAARLPETFFLRGADCWGWATWDRAWSKFNQDAAALLEQLQAKALTHAFDLDGSYGFTAMLRDFAEGLNDSWAIRWHASAFLNDMLTLYPGRSLVENIGLDSSGTHCGSSDRFGGPADSRPVRVDAIPVVEDRAARLAFIDYFGGPRTSEAPARATGPASPSSTVWQRVLRWLGRAGAVS